MPGKDQEYQYQQNRPAANKASNQSSIHNRADGLRDDTEVRGDIMQKENVKNKGSNKYHRDDKIGKEPGTKK